MWVNAFYIWSLLSVECVLHMNFWEIILAMKEYPVYPESTGFVLNEPHAMAKHLELIQKTFCS